ncbi:hypothetical protein DT076_13440 [Desertihabitans brevis]|uniref:Transmembrane protein n=1 Tax=Desertihabitans brevis TaxID=2268447 RepID=A0A367YT44_9ACTN|nr:hypothetical protein [Desertihabitans brevis]RCK68917.1 hypothetical protein DT076_13440 [Desertihabitans brevis]
MTDFPPQKSVPAELTRIGFSGTLWFAAALLAAAIGLAGLLAGGWRPAGLPTLAAVGFWVGAGAQLLGLGGLAWAGCPVIGLDRERADKNKSLVVRAGVIAFVLGGALASLAVLLS